MRAQPKGFTGCACGTCSSATGLDRTFRRAIVVTLFALGAMTLGAYAPPEVIYAAVVGGQG
jgi:hypothetical protein